MFLQYDHLLPTNVTDGAKMYVPLYPRESSRNVRVSVSPLNDGQLIRIVVGRVVSLRTNLNQSIPSAPRSGASNASAGLAKRIGSRIVPGHGPPRSRSISEAIVSFGS